MASKKQDTNVNAEKRDEKAGKSAEHSLNGEQVPKAPSIVAEEKKHGNDEIDNGELAKDPLLSQFGISLEDEQLMINLAKKDKFDLVAQMCEKYSSLFQDGKLVGGAYSRLTGKLIGLSDSAQYVGMCKFLFIFK